MTQNPTPSAPPQGTSFLDDSFGRLRTSGYHRDTDRRWFGGVCSGLAARLNVDPILIRAAAIVLAFVGGVGLTVYVVLWLLMPDRRGEILAERAIRHGDVGPIALLILAGFLVLGGIFSIGQGDGWIAPLWLVPVAVVAWFVISRRRAGGSAPWTPGSPTASPVPYGMTPPTPPGDTMSAPTSTTPPPTSAGGQPGQYAGQWAPYAGQPGSYRTPAGGQYPGPYGGRPVPPVPPRPIAPPPPPQPRRRRPSAFVGLVSLGVAMVGIGLGAALDGPTGFPGSAATLGFLLALVGVSVVVLTLGLTGRASGFSGFLTVVLALMLVISAAASRVQLQDGAGERTWTPVPATGTSSFELGAGDAVLDLSRLDTDVARTTPQTIEVQMGVGELTILVPAGLDARVDTSVGLGSIRHSGSTVTGVDESSGTDRSESFTTGDEPEQVVVDAELGIGQITIQEQ